MIKTIKEYTLIELLVVLTIIAIMMTFLLPAITRVRDLSYQTQCLNNYKQINVLLVQYSVDNDGYLPRFDTYDYLGNGKISRNTKGWHGHLAPYIYTREKNNWNEYTNGSDLLKEANNWLSSKGSTNQYGWPCESVDSLKVFICPKASSINFVGRVRDGFPFTYMGNTHFFGHRDNTWPKYYERTNHTSKRLKDIKDPMGKVLIWESAPHREPYDALGRMEANRATDDPLVMLPCANDPISYSWIDATDSDASNGGSENEGKGSHHWSMYFIHDSDQDNLEGYQISLFADGSAQKVHEWWLYLNASAISTVDGSGVHP